MISARSVTAAEDAVRIGLWQTVLNVMGIAGLFLTVRYARRAWLAARDSADADNAALNETRLGLKAARIDAREQNDRFEAQMRVAREGAEAAAEQTKIARASFETNTRPIITFERLITRFSDSYGRQRLAFVFRNSGGMPAIFVTMTVHSHLGCIATEHHHAKLSKTSDRKSVWGTEEIILRGEEKSFGEVTLNVAAMDPESYHNSSNGVISESKDTLFVFLKLDYRPAFDSVRASYSSEIALAITPLWRDRAGTGDHVMQIVPGFTKLT